MKAKSQAPGRVRINGKVGLVARIQHVLSNFGAMQVASSARYSGTFSAHCEVRQASRYPVVEEEMTDRPLDDLEEFSGRMGTNLNDLPATSPHGSDFRPDPQILGLATGPKATLVTPPAHRNGCFDMPRHSIGREVR